MNNKRKMTGADKWKYFLFRLKSDITFYIFAISLVLAFVFCILYLLKVITMAPLLIDLIILLISFIIFFCLDCLYIILFMRKSEIVDGHIFKTHRGREYANDSERSYMATKARAISEDGNITTNWQYSPRKISKEKNKPVFIILNKKGRGSEFYY